MLEIDTPRLSDEDVRGIRRELGEATTLPSWCYTSESFFHSEVKDIFLQSWLPVGRANNLRKPGDYFTARLFGESVLVVMDQDFRVRAYSNVCLHRATQIVSEPAGSAKAFVCPYHLWTYSLDGGLSGASHMGSATWADYKRKSRLPEFSVEGWNGELFINFCDSPAPLAPQLEKLTAALEPYRLSEWVELPTAGFTVEIDCNWKACLENFSEAYHHIAIHRETAEKLWPLEKVQCADTNDAYSLFVMPTFDDEPLRDAPIPVMPGLPKQLQASLVAVNVHPLYHALFWPGLALLLFMEPTSAQTTTMTRRVLVPPATAALPDINERLDAHKKKFQSIIAEDIAVFPKVKLGMTSRFYRPGRLSSQEKAVNQLHRFIVDKLESSDRAGLKSIA